MCSFLEHLLDLADADLVCSYRLVHTSRGPAAVNISAQDGRGETRLSDRFDGLPELCHPRRDSRSFYTIAGEDLAFGSLFPSFTAELRRVVYREPDVVGCLGIYFARPLPARSKKRRELSQLADEVDAHLAGEEVSDRAYESLRLKLIVDDRGNVERATTPWTGAIAAAELALAIERARAVHFESPTILRGAELAIWPLYAGDRESFLIDIAPAPPVALAADACLTPTQREVALYAASGATAAEISRSIDRGIETVRTHLREVYRRLGVASRLELARALDGSRCFVGAVTS